MSEKKNRADPSQYLTFHLAGEEYAIGILHVKEIIAYGAVTVVPQTPAFVRGVINLRGSVVPVVDLALKFGLSASPVTHRTCIIIVEVRLDGEPTIMGIIADSVSQVVELSADDILPPPPFGTRVKLDFLRGMGKAGAHFLLILDVDRVLSSAELGAATLPPGQAVAPGA
ncbi:MAG TPA: chemotaxis protein CheW [Candidatus Binatia bacterium]|nr:chemotaxis protein CheW [Candidatus Binatia bacterium]